MQPRFVRNGTSGTKDTETAEDLVDLTFDIPLRVWALVADGLSVIALLLCVSCLIQCANARNPTCCGIPCGGQRMIVVSLARHRARKIFAQRYLFFKTCACQA